MGTDADGVTSLLEGREPPSRPSNVPTFIAYALLLRCSCCKPAALLSAVALRRGDIRPRRTGPWWRVGAHHVRESLWAAFVLVLLPKQLGLPLSVLATGFPDLVLLPTGSALVGARGSSSRRSGRSPPSSAARTAAVPATCAAGTGALRHS